MLSVEDPLIHFVINRETFHEKKKLLFGDGRGFFMYINSTNFSVILVVGTKTAYALP